MTADVRYRSPVERERLRSIRKVRKVESSSAFLPGRLVEERVREGRDEKPYFA